MHHQGIRTLGARASPRPRSRPTAWSRRSRGRATRFLVGVQWHPEALTERDARMRRLFDAFVDAAAAWRESQSLSAAGV